MSEIKVNKVSPATGTAIQLGDSGDTFTVPSGATIVNSGTATGFGGGKVLQQVSSLLTTIASTTAQFPFDTSIPQNTEGVEYTTLAITPASATSKLHIQVIMHLGGSNNNERLACLFKDSGANALATSFTYMVAYTQPVAPANIAYIETSGSTSSRTYKVRFGCSSSGAGTGYVNRVNGTSYYGGTVYSGIIITEVEA